MPALGNIGSSWLTISLVFQIAGTLMVTSNCGMSHCDDQYFQQGVRRAKDMQTLLGFRAWRHKRDTATTMLHQAAAHVFVRT
eukprot:9490185-Pyramimonas_sp.AAC.2